MQKKVLGILLALTVLLCMLPLAFSASAATAVSDCTHDTSGATCPTCGATVIKTADELIALMNIDEAVDLTTVTASSSTDANYVAAKAALTKSYVLANDIDLSGYANQSPIGMYDSSNASVTQPLRFSGTFDGNGFTVYGVNIDSANIYVGFIGAMTSPAVVEDLTIAGPKNSSTLGTISGAKRVGGIAGYAANGVTIKNCTVKCNITATAEYAAGIIAEINTSATSGISLKITDCTNYGTVNGVKTSAGILAYLSTLQTNATLTIDNCVNNGAVTSTSSYAGGIFGAFGTSATSTMREGSSLVISDCVNNGNVTSKTGRTGGIAGSLAVAGTSTNYANTSISIVQCANTGDVTGTGTGVAGIVGYYSHKVATAYLEIIRCHNSGAIQSTQDVAGIAGYVYTNVVAADRVEISECWNSGSVQATTQYAGGIVALHYFVNVSDCWNTGDVTDAKGAPGGISGRINSSSANKSLLYSYNANGTMGVVGTQTSTGSTKYTVNGAYYKAASGVSDSYGGVAYDYETHFGTLNTNGKWTGTTNPMLAYFHPKHTFVNGTCECGVTDDCAHDGSLLIEAGENGGVVYVCGSCGKNAYVAETPLTDIYVATTGKTPLTCDSLATLGTETAPFVDFETAMEYAAAAAVESKTVTVHIVDDAYVPGSYSSPEYDGAIVVTGKVSQEDTTKGTLHFDDASRRRYYANGDITFEQLSFASTATDGARFFAQNHKWVMGEGIEMKNAETGIADAGYTTFSDFKLYLYGGFEFATGDQSPVMNTNLTVRSGDYWAIVGWNLNVSSTAANTSKCVASQGTGTLVLGKTNPSDKLVARNIMGFSSNIQPLSGDSKVTMILDGEMLVHSFHPGTQHNPDALTEELFETDLVLKNGVKLNAVASSTINGVVVENVLDITGATKTTNAVNLYVDGRSTEAAKVAALFVGENADSAIANMKTTVVASTYVDYCATYLDGGHATSGSIYTEGDTCDDFCPECGVITEHNFDFSNAVWVESGDAYTFTCGGCENVLATAEQPFVYVDANTHLDEDLGVDTADGLSPETAVGTLEEAIRRMAATGGKVILSDRYAIDSHITLPEYDKEIVFTSDRSTGFSYTGSTTGYIFNLGGPTKFENIYINNGSKIWIFAAHWNDLTFGEGLTVWGSSYVVMGQNDLPADGEGNAVDHNTPAHATLTLNPVNQKTSGKLFFQRAYLGDRGARGSNIAGYTVSNKTVVANINGVEIEELYAGTIGSTEENAQMVNCNVTVNMTGDANVHTMKNGYQNTQGDCDAYLHSLTLNLNDNATVSSALSASNVRP